MDNDLFKLNAEDLMIRRTNCSLAEIDKTSTSSENVSKYSVPLR